MSLTLEDSTTYQWILQKGIKKGEAMGEARGEIRARIAVILHLGTKRFGDPSAEVTARLTAMTDVPHLDRIADRVFDAASWDDLLGTP